MKISCDKCGAAYQVDETRIPPDGLTTKCTRCLHSFTVQRTPAAPDGPQGGDSGGEGHFFLRRTSGKVFGPFVASAIRSMLEQGKLSGEEQVSSDKTSWTPLRGHPQLSPGPSRAPAITPPPPGGEFELVDLPAPKDGAPREVIDLPGLPEEVIDLPQPKAPAHEIVDLPRPKRASADQVIDLPGLPRAGHPGSPPAQPPGGPAPAIGPVDLSDFDAGPGEFDLDAADSVDVPPPAPVGPADLPAPKDIIDLPAPKDVIDLPAPAGVVDLPQPKEIDGLVQPKETDGLVQPKEIDGLVQPKEIDGLPQPKDIGGLPQPKDLGGLPQPKPGQDAEKPRRGTGLAYGEVDFGEVGSGETDLPIDAGIELPSLDDLPAGTIDLPTPTAGGPADLAALVDEPPPQPGAEEVLEMPPAAQDVPPAHDVPAPDLPTEDVRPTEDEPGMDVLPPPRPAPGDAAPAARGAGSAARATAARAGPGRPRRSLRLSLPLPVMLGVGLVLFVLIVGVALGLLTDYGFFGAKLFSGEDERVVKLLDEAHTALRRDTLVDYRRAAARAAEAQRIDAAALDPRAVRAQALAMAALRLGERQGLGEAQGLVAALSSEDEPSLEVRKAMAIVQAAAGQRAAAAARLQQISDQAPADAEAAVYLGWVLLRTQKPAPARNAFKRALATRQILPAAELGLVHVERKQNNLKAARQRATEATKRAPWHPGLKVVLAELLRDDEPQQAAAIFEAVLKMPQAAPGERAFSEMRLGDLAAARGQNDEARKRYQAALALRPNQPWAHLGLARLLYRAGAYREALQHLQRARHLGDPALVMIARTQLAMGNALRARTILQGLLKNAPKKPEVRLLLGQSEEAHDAEQAIVHYKAAIEIKADYVEPYLRLAKLFLRQDKQTDAFATLQQAATALPKSAEVRTALGEAYLATEQLDLAQQTLEEALALNPTLNAALFALGRVLEQRGETAPALEKYRELQKRDRAFPGLAQRIGELHVSANNFKAAAEAYEQALTVDNPPKPLRLAAARAFVLAEAYDKALAQCSAVLAEHPNEAAAWAWRAAAHLGQGQEGDALVEIRQAIQREKQADFHVIHGRVLAALGRTAEAIDAMGQALKLDPERIDLRLERARLLVRGGAVRDGLREVQAVLKARPEHAEAYLYMGIAQADLRQQRQAIAAYQKAIALDPELGEAHFRLGQLLADDQRLAAALKHLEQAVDHGDENARWRDEALYRLGMVALQQNHRRRAISALQRFLEIAPKTAATRGEVLQTLRRLGVEPRAGKP